MNPGHSVSARHRRSPISVWCRNWPMRGASASTSWPIRGCLRPKPPPRKPRRSPTPRRTSSPMPSKPITMDAVYTAPGYLFRRMQQIAVALFVEECKAFDLTPVQYASLVAIHTHPGIDATRLAIVPAVERAQARMLQPLKPADRKTLLALMTQLVDLNNEASRVPLRAEDALEHLGKST